MTSSRPGLITMPQLFAIKLTALLPGSAELPVVVSLVELPDNELPGVTYFKNDNSSEEKCRREKGWEFCVGPKAYYQSPYVNIGGNLSHSNIYLLKQ